jgi:hypothetical protein
VHADALTDQFQELAEAWRATEARMSALGYQHVRTVTRNFRRAFDAQDIVRARCVLACARVGMDTISASHEFRPDPWFKHTA